MSQQIDKLVVFDSFQATQWPHHAPEWLLRTQWHTPPTTNQIQYNWDLYIVNKYSLYLVTRKLNYQNNRYILCVQPKYTFSQIILSHSTLVHLISKILPNIYWTLKITIECLIDLQYLVISIIYSQVEIMRHLYKKVLTLFYINMKKYSSDNTLIRL